jgi:hypothetical protein
VGRARKNLQKHDDGENQRYFNMLSGFSQIFALDREVLIQQLPCLTERPFQKRASSFQREQIRSAGRGRSFPIRLHVFFVRPFISRRPVLAKCKTDESEHHQDGSGYHQPMRIFHRGEHPSFPLRLQPSSHDQPPDQSLSTRLPIRRASA